MWRQVCGFFGAWKGVGNVTGGMRQQLQNVWQTTIKKQERQQREEGTDRQTLDYHVDMRHVADVADNRQAGRQRLKKDL